MKKLTLLVSMCVLGGCASISQPIYKPLTLVELEKVPENCENAPYVLPWLEQHTDLTIRHGTNKDLSRVKYKLWKLRSKCT